MLAALLFPVASSARAGTAEDCIASNAFLKINETIDRCEAALKTPPVGNKEKARLHFQQGLAFHWLTRPDASIPQFDAAILLDPDLVEARLQRGWAYTQMLDYEKAYRDFTDVLSQNPEATRAMHGLAFIYYGGPQHENAVALLKEAIRIDPNQYHARSLLALHYLDYERNTKEAIAQYEFILSNDRRAVEETPITLRGERPGVANFRITVQIDLAEALSRAQRFDEALQVASEAVDAAPAYVAARAARSEIFYGLRQYDRALEEAEKAIELNSQGLAGLKMRMRATAALRRYAATVEAATKTIEFSGGDPFTRLEALSTRATANLRLGKRQEARVDLDEVLIYPSVERTSILLQIKDAGYFNGSPDDNYNSEMINGLEACLIDPECLK
jgi:tetratricopeptide (TPR) repeat protein